MKTFSNNTHGTTVNVDVPETVEEYDTLAGKIGMALADAISNCVYRSWNPAFGRAAVKRLCEKYDVEVPQKHANGKPVFGAKKKDGTQSPILLGSQQFVKHLLDEGTMSEDEWAEEATAIAKAVPFDPSESSGGGRIKKEYLETAANILTAIENKQTTAKDFVKLIETNNPGFKVGEPTVENIAVAVKTDQERIANEKKAAYTGG